MNFPAKYLLLLIVLISSVNFGFAQDSVKSSTTGEIVMTKAELQSFLNKIAELKRQHIARQEKLERQAKLNADTQSGNGHAPDLNNYKNVLSSVPNQQSNSIDEQKLFTQLELINARLHSLMSDMELLKIKSKLNDLTPSTSGNLPLRQSNRQQPQIYVEPNHRPVIIQQKSPPQVYVNPGLQSGYRDFKSEQRDRSLLGEQSNDSLNLARQKEQLVLKNRIKALENEMKLFQELSKGSGDDEKNKYNQNISSLSAQIDSLGMQLEHNKRKSDSVKLKRQSSLSNILKDFSYNIYFKNNSTTIPSSDYQKLREVVNIAEQHPRSPVVLKGFASKSGKPQYNDKISFQRAVNVKKWLSKNGLNLKDIVIRRHGVDKSVDASRARRVEITFMVQ